MTAEFKTLGIRGKYMAIVKPDGALAWQKVRDRHKKLVICDTASQAINQAKDIYGIQREGYQTAACPAPEKPLTPEQRAFYDKKAEQMSNSRHLSKRKPVVTVVNRAGRVVKKIGELK